MSRLNVANFRHPDGTTDNINLDSSGRVGLGTSSPSKQLEISASSSEAGIALTSSGRTLVMTSHEQAGVSQAAKIGTSSNHELRIITNNTERVRVTSTGDLRFDSGYGSVATAYGVRAWVNFNGTGTPAIRTSGNCSSITDNGTGYYTVNFTTAMPDTDYAAIGTAAYRQTVQTDEGTRTTSSVTVSTSIGASGTSLVSHEDKSIVQLVVVR